MQILSTYLTKAVEADDPEIPWSSLKYLIGEVSRLFFSFLLLLLSSNGMYSENIFQVIYGGRVIDSFDRRIVKTYMNEYMGDFLFDVFQPFHFYQNENIDYIIPEVGTKDDYLGRFFYFAATVILFSYIKFIVGIPKNA